MRSRGRTHHSSLQGLFKKAREGERTDGVRWEGDAGLAGVRSAVGAVTGSGAEGSSHRVVVVSKATLCGVKKTLKGNRG